MEQASWLISYGCTLRGGIWIAVYTELNGIMMREKAPMRQTLIVEVLCISMPVDLDHTYFIT